MRIREYPEARPWICDRNLFRTYYVASSESTVDPPQSWFIDHKQNFGS